MNRQFEITIGRMGRLFVFGSILAAAGWLPVGAAETVAARPNILFIFSDDHSLPAIGAYDTWLSSFCKQQKVTPNIDSLASQGALFPNSFCCNSLCSPSRAAILTGLHSHANGVTNLSQAVWDGVWMFPAAVREAGYQNAVIGKWHLGNQPSGFEYWRILPGQGAYWDPAFIGPDGQEKKSGYTTDLITDMGLEWLKARDKNKPFMLMVHHKAPHRNWMPPDRYFKWLADVKIPEPSTLFDDYANRASPSRNQKLQISNDMELKSDLKLLGPGMAPGGLPAAMKDKWLEAFGPRNAAFEAKPPAGDDLTRWKYQEYMKDYLRCVKAVDDSVGRYLDYLKAEGLDGNTVVIYASDQGFYNGEHGWFDKRWIYEESLHMPLVVRWPGVVKPGSRPAALVQNIDYAATFLDIAGAKNPGGLHGRSIVPVLKGETPVDWRTSVYYRYYDPGHGVAPHYGLRTARHTLAHFPKTDEWELFDLEKDPQQLRSVYADPAQAPAVASLKEELKRLQSLYHDDGSIKPPPSAKSPAAPGRQRGERAGKKPPS